MVAHNRLGLLFPRKKIVKLIIFIIFSYIVLLKLAKDSRAYLNNKYHKQKMAANEVSKAVDDDKVKRSAGIDTLNKKWSVKVKTKLNLPLNVQSEFLNFPIKLPPNVNIPHETVRDLPNRDKFNANLKNQGVVVEKFPTDERVLNETVKALNLLGKMSITGSIPRILTILRKETLTIRKDLFQSVIQYVNGIDLTTINEFLQRRQSLNENLENIVVAILVCGERRQEAMVMLKSAIIFSLDANLHLVVFSDKETILNIGEDILSLKLGLNKVGHHGFTFELHLESYPQDEDGPNWKEMYRTCASQRLFMPSLLKHHDALIYLDTDVIILSSLKEMWDIFKTKMGSKKMLGITPNSESPDNIYSPRTLLPYYGVTGINAGVMLMNLTQCREFNFEARSKAVYTAYTEWIDFADQDIINAIFHAYPDYVVDITCSYNFYWIHCSSDFCGEVLNSGVRILHGNSGTFVNDKGYEFMRNTFKAFQNLDIFADPYDDFFDELKDVFITNDRPDCKPLKADLLYGQAEEYLQRFLL